MNRSELPSSRLYKCGAFSERTMAMLVDDELHSSDAGTLNDPLDARPYVEVDVGTACWLRFCNKGHDRRSEI